MPLRIYGFIGDDSGGGSPISGLRIRAWDRDLFNGDDLLGESITSSNGHYEIKYNLESLVSHLGLLEFGRPDIYITVENQNSGGKWVRLAQSEEHKNHNLKRDLRIDYQLPFSSEISRNTNFLPERNGFHFVNSFVVKPDILGFDLGEWKMGFCGGMCAGALKRFRKGLLPPDDDSAPPDGNQLHEELLKRQIKAMSPKMLPKLIEWQASPDMSSSKRKSSIGERTTTEWKKLKRELDDQNPTMIVLIRSSGMFGNPTDNHQVLAIGYDFKPSTMDLVIYTYDPNFPDQTQTLSMNLGLLDNTIDLVDTGSIKTRGFFVNPAAEIAVEN